MYKYMTLTKIVIEAVMGGYDRAEKLGDPVFKSRTVEVVTCLP